jgi:hypothetical protein
LFLLPADWDPLRPRSLLKILWYSQSGNHQETNLAKFGYTLDMKVGKNRILLCFWQPTGTYDQKISIQEKKNWNLAIFGHFFHEKSTLLIEIIFFRSKFGENSPVKEMPIKEH